MLFLKKTEVEGPTESLERGRLPTVADEWNALPQSGGRALPHVNCK
jgi:hypothetical protein